MWIKSESSERPIELDTTSSKKYNYARRNIREVVETDEMGTHTMFEYDENKILKSDWDTYLEIFYNTLNNDKNTTKINETATSVDDLILTQADMLFDMCLFEMGIDATEFFEDFDLEEED